MAGRKHLLHVTLYPGHNDIMKEYANKMHRNKSFLMEKILKTPEDVLANIIANASYDKINTYKNNYVFSLSLEAIDKLNRLSSRLHMSKSAIADRLIENIDKILGANNESSVVQN
jgi:predicted transcriptional regulator